MNPYTRKQSCPCTKTEFVKLQGTVAGNKITKRCCDCGSETTTLEPYRKPKQVPEKSKKARHSNRHLGVLPLPEPKPKPESSGRKARSRTTRGKSQVRGASAV